MKILRTEKSRVHLSSTAHYFNAAWQSVDRIPIVLALLREELNRLEAAHRADGPSQGTGLPQKLSSYQTLYQHWHLLDLNPRQTEWVAEIGFYLQTWQRIVSSLSFQSPSPVLLPSIDQKQSLLTSHLGTLTHTRTHQDDEIPQKIYGSV
jgi:hypothetical protein